MCICASCVYKSLNSLSSRRGKGRQTIACFIMMSDNCFAIYLCKLYKLYTTMDVGQTISAWSSCQSHFSSRQPVREQRARRSIYIIEREMLRYVFHPHRHNFSQSSFLFYLMYTSRLLIAYARFSFEREVCGERQLQQLIVRR